MRLVVDDQVERAAEAFDVPGVELVLIESRRIDRDAVRDADALVVRSTRCVDAALVRDTRLRFVGSATVGVDHVDEGALRDHAIAFAAAPGSSAASVAQFTLAALVLACDRLGIDWTSRRLAVVGAGAIGGRVARTAERLGLPALRHDPPLADAGDERCVPLERLADADVVSLHVPLTRDGEHATAAMVDDAWLERLASGTLLINTARGGVVDGAAVLRALESGCLGGAVLDVFPDEPLFDADLAAAATLVTPHVAGRSEEGLVANTAAVRDALDRALGLGLPPWTPAFPAAGSLRGASVAEAVRAAQDLDELDGALREACARGEGRADIFRELRRKLPRRRDLSSFATAPDAAEEVCRFHAALPAR